MKKTLSIIISLALIIGIVLVLKNQKTPPVKTNTPTQQVSQNNNNAQDASQYASTPTADSTNAIPSSNVAVKDGVQYITIDVKRGYSPQTTNAKGGIPTKIIAKTSETYDCSSSLVIRSAKYQAYLPPTGDTEVDLGTPKSGETTDGVCGMGMYSFEVKYM